MKILSLVTVIISLFSIAPSQQHAPLGKLLGSYYASMPSDIAIPVIVSFVDKGIAAHEQLLLPPETFLTEKAVERRARMNPGQIITVEDLPLSWTDIQSVEETGVSIRHELKWFNAISVMGTKSQINALRLLPRVKEVEMVARFRTKKDVEEVTGFDVIPPSTPLTNPTVVDYGLSLTQNAQIKTVDVHNLGITGAGVVIAVFDDAFPNLNHPALASRPILARFDFIRNDTILATDDTHGQRTFSTVGAFAEGNLIGPAYGATFVLARTENVNTETPVEEDAWARAAIWADSIGVDVITSSLSYLTYDSPWPNWSWQNMDGKTTLITKAADRAVEMGIVVLNSAGNSGDNASRNTLGGPADGFHVMAIGAVTSTGSRSSFSSVGPTADGRIKPDVMAMGSSVRVVSGTSGYTTASGTSFSCPLAAGVAGLVLSGNPGLTPFQVREAMRQTASRANNPDKYFGWGLLDALKAVNYAWITHTPLNNSPDTTARTVIVKIRSRIPLNADSTRLYFGVNGNITGSTPLLPFGNPAFNEYRAQIPYLGSGVNITYYIKTANAHVNNRLPLGTGYFSYQIGADVTPPSIAHTTRGNIAYTAWPPRLTAVVKDESGPVSVSLEYSLNGVPQTAISVSSPDSVYSDTLRIPRSTIRENDLVAYRFKAVDPYGNTGFVPPTGFAEFRVKNFTHINADFENSGAGFTSSNDWEYGSPSGSSPAAFGGTKYWATKLNGNYTQGPRLSSLTTPTYQVYSNKATFSFYHWYEMESRFDGGNVKASVNGGLFQVIQPVGGYPDSSIFVDFGNPLAGQPGYSSVIGARWTKAEFDLSGITGEGNTVALRFDFGADNNTLRYRGWYVDNFVSDGFGTAGPLSVTPRENTPLAFALEQNYPNPFNPATTIGFSLPGAGRTRLTIFDLLGREVAVLIDQELAAGAHSFTLDASGLSSGTYFYKLHAGQHTAVRKLVVLK